jgi:CubicO group peptidase (beta-lactamase class C family)
MTATLLAMEVQRGRLPWESTLAELLPQLNDHMHPDYRPVTVRQLLTHRAGLPANSPRMQQVDTQRTETEQRVELFDRLLREPPEYPPGSEYHYSNLGYMLAGLVAETLTQRPWQQLMQRELFRPLGMSSAGFGPPGRTDGIDQPWGHRSDPASGLQPIQHDNPLVLGPAGRVHASLIDWARFLALHLNHQPRRSLLSEAMIEQLHQPADGEHYALGWGVHRRAWADGVALSHTGSNTYWFAVVWMSPGRDLAMVAATNAGGDTAAQACDEAVVSLLNRAARR